MSVSSLVSRLSPIAIRTSSHITFAAALSPHATEVSWSDYANTEASITLSDFLQERQQAAQPLRCIIFGEQHHQPRVLAAQLSLLKALSTPPLDYKVTILMEHFNLLQQPLLHTFAKDGDAEALQAEYAKSNEGFRLTTFGYLPLLQLARELENVNSEIITGFPPREWARIIMREGIAGIQANDEIQKTGVLNGFNGDRWKDINVSREHSAYIKAMTSGGNKPVLQEGSEIKQGGLSAAQAFKDSIMAWKIDEELQAMQKREETPEDGQKKELLLVICGSGHCDFGLGVPERIRACEKEEMLRISTKPDEGGYWSTGSTGSDLQEGESQLSIADAVIVYEAVDV